MQPDDKIKVGYQATLALISYDGQLIWRAFGAMLSANTALAAIAGAALKLFPQSPYSTQILAVLGIAICLLWFLVLTRQFAYHRYWFAWARHFENDALAPITTLGKVYGEGGTREAGEDIPVLARFGWVARTFKVQWLMVLVIGVFVVLYVLLFLAARSDIPLQPTSGARPS